MKKVFTLLLGLFLMSTIMAEGTRELAPNRNIHINGFPTSDVAALHIGKQEFNNFAVINNNNPYHQLYVNIQDPAAECIYIGFSPGHLNRTEYSPPLIDFSFVVKDPEGNVVYGPEKVSPTTANIENWEQAYNGPNIGSVTQGYQPIIVDGAALMSKGWKGEGDYYIQFDYNVPDTGVPDEALLIDFWDLTVVDCLSTFPDPKKGRVWSYNWSLFAINDLGFPDRPFNGSFYVCAIDSTEQNTAFITKVDFQDSELRPGAFSVAFNGFGTTRTGDVQYDRKSARNGNYTRPEYPIFLNDPIELYGTPQEGEIEFISMVRGDDGRMCFQVKATRTGVVELLLDFHKGDGEYTEGTSDVMLSYNIQADELNALVCIPWDGMDGEGNAIIDRKFPIQITYNRGVFHLPIYDAEYLEDGFKLERVRPAGPPPLLYYDDSEILNDSGSGEPKVNLTGCETPCHTWNNYIGPDIIGFGNMNTINSWWYSTRAYSRAEASVHMNYYIPNAFSPNKDGINDYAKVFIDEHITGVKSYEVYDRWGNRVYEEYYTDSIREMKGWDGEYKGYEMPPAVFTYKATIEVHPGVYIIDHGTLTLIR